MKPGNALPQHGSNISIDLLTRLGRVLSENTGIQPVIHRVPSDRSQAWGDMLWWGSADSSGVFVGARAADAERLIRMRDDRAWDGTSDALRAAFSDLLSRVLGSAHTATQHPADYSCGETFKMEFSGGESVELVVAQTETAPQNAPNLEMLMDIELPITIRFGSTTMALRDIAILGSGSLIEFDRGVDDPVEVMVNGRVVARGEAVMVKGSYGVRISEISSRRELLSSSFVTAQDSRQTAGEQIG